jgi:hypothetical protein
VTPDLDSYRAANPSAEQHGEYAAITGSLLQRMIGSYIGLGEAVPIAVRRGLPQDRKQRWSAKMRTFPALFRQDFKLRHDRTD